MADIQLGRLCCQPSSSRIFFRVPPSALRRCIIGLVAAVTRRVHANLRKPVEKQLVLRAAQPTETRANHEKKELPSLLVFRKKRPSSSANHLLYATKSPGHCGCCSRLAPRMRTSNMRARQPRVVVIVGSASNGQRKDSKTGAALLANLVVPIRVASRV